METRAHSRTAEGNATTPHLEDLWSLQEAYYCEVIFKSTKTMNRNKLVPRLKAAFGGIHGPSRRAAEARRQPSPDNEAEAGSSAVPAGVALPVANSVRNTDNPR